MLSLLAPGAALAEAAPAAFAAYAAGDYERAVDLAEGAGTAEDLALAARAMNAVAYFDAGRKTARRTAGDAYEIAEQAIRLDPRLPEAHLQAAISLALKGARMSHMRAFFSGLAGKARERIDAALGLDPENPWALSTSAAWRIEVARRGGGALYDADPQKGHEEFLKARALAPGNPVIAYECALRLLADGRAEWRADGLAALDDALAATPTTEFESDIQALARAFAAAIAAGDKAEKAFIDAQP
ncbi:MAG: hypothetical protein A3E78_05845 [Alphaproteobacteria bacterium RIFCSPHIGHO2_12_FULL_63_12]|nr:MAG: hypothetical protein A3E78_05845 [Alphaproteobacteria bacterium RIFCSPHIGHO2_12_FULL_63_12]